MMKTVVARSTFRSQNVQITSVSDHFDELVTGVGRGSRCHLVADLCQGRLPLWSRDGKVKCGREPGISRQVHVSVSWASTVVGGVIRALGQKQPGFFPFRAQPTFFRPTEHQVTDSMVAL
jgi:hypothetical protein